MSSPGYDSAALNRITKNNGTYHLSSSNSVEDYSKKLHKNNSNKNLKNMMKVEKQKLQHNKQSKQQNNKKQKAR